jgi:hypothetical protein
MTDEKSQWVHADFNGLFGNILCLSHDDTATNYAGNIVTLDTGLHITAYDEDIDKNGNRDDVIASGVVEPSPDWLTCKGSRWILRIDANGVRNESDLTTARNFLPESQRSV